LAVLLAAVESGCLETPSRHLPASHPVWVRLTWRNLGGALTGASDCSRYCATEREILCAKLTSLSCASSRSFSNSNPNRVIGVRSNVVARQSAIPHSAAGAEGSPAKARARARNRKSLKGLNRMAGTWQSGADSSRGISRASLATVPLDRGRESGHGRSPSLQTGQAVLPHPAFQSVGALSRGSGASPRPQVRRSDVRYQPSHWHPAAATAG